MIHNRAPGLFAVCLIVLGCASASGATPQSSPGPLRVHPQNPRYFTDSGGKPIYLAGSHVWYTVQGPDTSRALQFLDTIKARGHNFTRVWSSFFYLQMTYDDVVNAPPAPWPFLRTGPGAALDGGLKFDLTRPNSVFFQSLRAFVQEANNRGIYCSIMMFGSYNLMRNAEYVNSAWHASNNINPQTSGQLSGPDFFNRSPGVLSLQEAHVRRVIDELNGFDNVIWEIMNESMDAPGVTAWHDHFIKYIRSYEAGKPKRHLVGMTGGPAAAGGAKMGQSVADWISPDNGTAGDYKNGGPGGYAGKVVLNDTDHLWGVIYDEPIARPWVWKTFTRGSHPLFMEDRRLFKRTPTAAEDRVRRAMGHTINYSRRINLAAAVPRGDLTSTGYALATPGTEYLVYQPATGAFTVNLAAASYTYEWFNPSTGAVTLTGSITAGAGNRSFTAPFSGDAVLYLKASAATGTLVPPTVTSPANGTAFPSTTTQVTVTWNSVAGAAGYLVRCRDTGSNAMIVYQDLWTPTQINVPVSAGRSYRFWIHSAASNFSYSNPGSWSAETSITFSVNAPGTGGTLQIPTITSPANGTVFPGSTTLVTFRWNAVPGAAGYLVRCREPGSSTFAIYKDMWTATSIGVPVSAGRSYRFWIHSAAANFSYSNPASYTGEASITVSVSAGSSLAVPTITSPAAGTVFPATTTQVTFTWNPVPGAAGYLIRCSDTGSGAMILYRDMWTSTSISVPVSRGRSYRFWIHSAASNFSYSIPSSFSAQANRTFSVSN